MQTGSSFTGNHHTSALCKDGRNLDGFVWLEETAVRPCNPTGSILTRPILVLDLECISLRFLPAYSVQGGRVYGPETGGICRLLP